MIFILPAVALLLSTAGCLPTPQDPADSSISSQASALPTNDTLQNYPDFIVPDSDPQLTLKFGYGGYGIVRREVGEALLDMALPDLSNHNPFERIPAFLPPWTQGIYDFVVSNEFHQDFTWGEAYVAVRGYKAWMNDRSSFGRPLVSVWTPTSGRPIGHMCITGIAGSDGVPPKENPGAATVTAE